MKVTMWYVQANGGAILQWCHDKAQAEYLLGYLQRDASVRDARIGFKTYG